MDLTPEEPMTEDVLTQIAHVTGAERDRLIEAFLADRRALIDRVTTSVLRFMTPGRPRAAPVLRPDVESVVWECAWQILRESHESLDQVVSFDAVLTSRAKRDAVKHVESSAVTGVAGTANLRTKQRAVGTSRRELRSVLGVEPDTDQLLEYHNDKMRSRRSDPIKQGVLASREDLEVAPRTVLAAADTGPVPPDGDDDAALTSLEGHDLASEILDRCRGRSGDLGLVAQCWLAEYVTDGHFDSLSVSDIAREVGHSAEWTRSRMLDVRVIARDVALEWGVGH